MSEEGRLRGCLGDALRQLAEAQGRPVEIWLRDDDAVRPGPALDRLIGIAADADAPLALAVIPATAEPALAERLRECPEVSVLQHGWAHADHGAPDAKKAEFGPDRPIETMLHDVAMGRTALAGFRRVLPIFVPPWNRIDAGLAERLPALGFAALSVFGDRSPQVLSPLRLNTHVDPVGWRSGGGFLGLEAVLTALTLRLGRLLDGRADRTEATGLLTHHRVHDAATFAFLEDLLQCLAKDDACRFVSGAELLEAAASRERTAEP